MTGKARHCRPPWVRACATARDSPRVSPSPVGRWPVVREQLARAVHDRGQVPDAGQIGNEATLLRAVGARRPLARRRRRSRQPRAPNSRCDNGRTSQAPSTPPPITPGTAGNTGATPSPKPPRERDVGADRAKHRGRGVVLRRHRVREQMCAKHLGAAEGAREADARVGRPDECANTTAAPASRPSSAATGRRV